jgi:carbon-monoxide dehydrogenase medium subunit
MTASQAGDGQALYVATSLGVAVAALAARAPHAVPLAGATWIMRAPIRQERDHRAIPYVAIGAIDELRRIDVNDHEIVIGACTTHAEVAARLGGLPDCRGLAAAAGNAANPAIRRIATIGGNLCAVKFAASDFAPALLAAGARVELRSPGGMRKLPIERFLESRSTLIPGSLLVRLVVPRGQMRSAHVRLPLRKAGDYPVAIVSMAAKLAPDGVAGEIRIAVGSVEPVARRWPHLEAEMTGRKLDADRAHALAAADAGSFSGREAVEAPGWYRLQVLPALVRRAVEILQAQP